MVDYMHGMPPPENKNVGDPIDWHGLGMSWALAESFACTNPAAQWTADDVARAFAAGAAAAIAAERGRT